MGKSAPLATADLVDTLLALASETAYRYACWKDAAQLLLEAKDPEIKARTFELIDKLSCKRNDHAEEVRHLAVTGNPVIDGRLLKVSITLRDTWHDPSPEMCEIAALVNTLPKLGLDTLQQPSPDQEENACGWQFDVGVVWFRGREYALTPLPEKILEIIVTSRKSVLSAADLRDAWGDDGLPSDDSIRGHVGTIRQTLIQVAKDIGASEDVISDPIPFVRKSGWHFLLPRE